MVQLGHNVVKSPKRPYTSGLPSKTMNKRTVHKQSDGRSDDPHQVLRKIHNERPVYRPQTEIPLNSQKRLELLVPLTQRRSRPTNFPFHLGMQGRELLTVRLQPFAHRCRVMLMMLVNLLGEEEADDIPYGPYRVGRVLSCPPGGLDRQDEIVDTLYVSQLLPIIASRTHKADGCPESPGP